MKDFYTTVFIGRNVDAAPRFLATRYIQRSANVPTGLQGFMDTFRPRFARKLPPDYKREILRIVGKNDVVVIFNKQSRTSPEGKHEILLQFDMFALRMACSSSTGTRTLSARSLLSYQSLRGIARP